MAGEEEKLCEQMQLYQRLFDGSSQLHSNKITSENAWKDSSEGENGLEMCRR